MQHEAERGLIMVQGKPMSYLMWQLMIIVGVLIYSSYTILMHLCEVDGRIPFSSAAVNFLIELTKFSVCLVALQRSRLGYRAVLHLGWIFSHPSLSIPYSIPAVLYAINANIAVHMQLEMDPISYQILACGLYLGCQVIRDRPVVEEGPPLNWPTILPFVVPALLYFINNNLAVYMQLQMDSATYQVMGNFKILTTALLYRVIIKRAITRAQWLALFILLLAGISNSYGGLNLDGDHVSGKMYISPKGITMILCYCIISGLAGVYSEYVFKNKYEMSVFIQSGLLYIYGSIFNLLTWLFVTYNSGSSWNLVNGFTWHTWAIVITQALCGLIIGTVMKYGSNITRLFIISSATILTTFLSMIIFHLQLNLYFVFALVLVSIALALYHNIFNVKL